MNYGAGIAVVVGGVLLVIGIKGSQSAVWKTLTGNAITPSTNSFGGGAGGNIPNPTPTPTMGNSGASTNVGNAVMTKYGSMAYADAQSAGISGNDFVAQMLQESGLNPNAVSPAGAQGIAQFMPATAASLGVNPFDPVAALSAAAKLMGNYIRTYGSEAAALASYNAGPGAYENALTQSKAHPGTSWEVYLPSETQNYINTIIQQGGSN